MSFDALASGWSRVLGVDRKQFNMFFERMMDGFAYHKIVVDKAGKPVDYVFIEVNSAFERLTGLKREALIGKRITEVMPGVESDSADWIGVYGKVALTGEPVQFENYAMPLDKWYKVSAYCPKKGYFVALFEDITERKKAEGAVAKKQDELQTILDSSHSWIFYKDKGNRFLRVNKAFAEAMEMSKDRLEGRSLFDLYPREQAESYWNDDKEVMAFGTPKLGIVEQMQSKKGLRWVQTDKIPYRDASGNIIGIIGFAVDITERKEAEDALRKSEQRWQTTVSSIGDAVITTDLDGKVTFLNRIAEGLTGWFLAEASGRPLDEVFCIVNAHTRGKVESPVIRVLKEGLVVGLANHTILLKKSGGEIPIDDSGAPIRDKEGKVTGVVLIFRNITERKKAEEKIAQQALMISNVNDAIIGYSTEQNVTFWNKAAERLYGYTAEEVFGKFGFDLLKPQYIDVTRQELLDKIAMRGHFETESVRQTKNGGSVYVEAHVILLRDEAGKPIGYVSVDRDITERKKAEEDLRESQSLLQNIIDGSPSFIFLKDKDGRFITINKRLEESFGMKRKELKGKTDYDIFPKEVADSYRKNDLQVLKTKQTLQTEEIFDSPDGKKYTLLANKFPLFDASGEVTAICGISTDITERKKAEEALSKQAALIDLSPDAIIVRKLNGVITFWSHGAENLYGWSKEEAIGKTTHNILKTEFSMPLNEIIVQVASRGYWSGELTHTTKTGRRLFVRSHWLGRFDKNKENVLEILETNVDITDQKQMQDKLEEYAKNLEGLVEERTKEATAERERLYNVLETLPAYVILLDKDYKVPFANRVFRERFGEDKGRHCYDFLFNRTSPCENCETYKVLETGKPHHWEWTGPDKRNYDIYDYPFKVADGSTQILEMGIDITQRKMAEATVQAERKRLFDVLETMPQMICLLTPDYYVKFANRAFREKFGESQGKHCYDYCFGKKEPCAFCESYEALKTGKPHHWEVNTEDGRIIDAYDFPFTDADGSPLILEIDTDVTEQKRAVKQVRDAARYARSLLEASLDPLVTISAEGKITDVNEATVIATGCSRKELIGSDFSEYFTQPDKAREGYKKVFTNGYVIDYPLILLHKSGELRNVLYNASVYRNEKGEIQGVFAAARDVTEISKYREHLEDLVAERTAALEESQRKLEEKAAEVEEYATGMETLAEERALKLKDAERLAAIGATAGMVGHDIRNPLQAITGDVYLLSSDVANMRSSALKESLTESLESIQKSVDYVNKIVQDLQDYAKPLKPAVHETDLQAILDDIVKKNGKPHNVILKQTIAKDAQTIKTDPDMLKRILGNLISNAIQAMPNGGSLTVRATKKIDNTVLTVRDTGTGIPEQAKANLFTPLFTTKSKGQGFGLAVVKRMTEALGGTVAFESEEGKGTKFTITLPQQNQD